MNNYNDYSRLLTQGAYSEVIQKVDQLSSTQSDYWECQLLKVKVFFEQGRIPAAIKAVKHLVKTVENQDVKLKAQVYDYYLQLYVQKADQAFEKLNFFVEEVLEKDCSTSTKVLAQDLQVRSEMFRLSLGMVDRGKGLEVLQSLKKNVKDYQSIGENKEALSALRRTVAFTQTQSLDLTHLTSDLLQELLDLSKKYNEPIYEAEARLLFCELGFENLVKHNFPEKEAKKFDEEIEEILALFNKGGHRFGESKINYRLGNLFLKYNVPYGVTLLEKTLLQLEETGNITDTQGGWRALNTWYTKHGNPEKAEIARKNSNRFESEVQLPMNANISLLSEVDVAFRNGYYSKAKKLLSRAEKIIFHEKSADSSIIIYANLLSQLGLRQEAIEKLQRLEKIAANSIFLSQLYEILANTQFSEDIDGALATMEKAIKMSRSRNDAIGEARFLQRRAWYQIQKQRYLGKEIKITDAIEQDFKKAEEILQNQFTLEGYEALCNLYQEWGQINFTIKNYETCEIILNKAEGLYRNAELLPGLAFTLLHHGLFLIEIGRNAGPKIYDEALKKFTEAQRLFLQCQMNGIWQVQYHMGLCQFEAGARETAESLKLRRWNEAVKYFEKASSLIDLLRGFTTDQFGQEQQETGAAFSIDKQSFFQIAFQFEYFFRKNHKGALKWLERMKNRSLLDAMANFFKPGDDLLKNEDIKKEQLLSLQKQAAENFETSQHIQSKIDEVLQKIAANEKLLAYAELKKGNVMQWDIFQPLLKSQEKYLKHRKILIIQYYYSQNRMIVFGMKSDWDKPLTHEMTIDHEQFSRSINQHFRKKGGVRIMMEDVGDDEWQAYRNLIEPVSIWSNPGDIVCFIPYGILHDLPLHTLKLDGAHLIKRNPVFYNPSLSTLAYLWQSETDHLNPFEKFEQRAVFGDSRNNLENAKIEARAIAEKLGVKAVIGEEVTKIKFVEAMKKMNMIHLAGHGELSNMDGLKSRLFMAGEKDLLATDLFSIESKTRLMILSGCETGLSEYRIGDELMGMVRGFLFSGIKSLIVSQWKVNDNSTKLLFDDVYTNLINEDREALVMILQKAMLNLLEKKDYESFYHWGSFVLIGDWK